jgi:cobalt-zinc-cadmium efflux system outer membrane protein
VKSRRAGRIEHRFAWLLSAGATAILACALARGEETKSLTLAAALLEAQTNNPEIRALSAGIASARGEVTTAETWDNPDLGVSPGFRRTQPESGPAVREFHGVFEFKQTIEFPGKRRLRRALAEKNVVARKLALAGFRNQLTIDVRRVFLSVQLSKKFLALKEQQVALAQGFYEAARKKVAGGFAPDFEATKAEVEIVAAQKALRDARAQMASACGTLNTLLGRDPQTELEIADFSETTVALPGEAVLLQQLPRLNTALQIQEIEVERSGLSLQSARKSRLPDLTVGPSVEYLKDEQTYDMAFSLPLPLWDSKKGEIATATAEQRKAVAELEKSRQETVRDVVNAHQNLASAKEALALYTPEFLGKLKTALDEATQSYAEGRANLLVYLETQRTYFDTQASFLETLQKLYEAQAALESAVGVPLSELQEKTK